MSLLIVGLDNTIVNVALPSIGRELHAGVAGLQWTVDAYTMVLASLLMLSGSMGDRFGRRLVFQIGLALFALGSALCSVAPTLGGLIVFRMVQAVGGSMLNPVAMSIIRNVFTDPRERAQAIGMWGATVGLSLALGPVVGGALVVSAGWRSVFWINIPVGLAALALTARFVPESRAARPRRLDPVGQALVIVLLASLTYAIIEAPSAGWLSAQSVGLFALAAGALAGLLRYEPRHREPLLELRFFRSVPFSGASAIAVCSFAALGGFLFLNTLYLQEVRGCSPLAAGLYTLPIAAMTLIFAPLSGRLVGRRGPRAGLLVGGLGIALGGALLTGLTSEHAARLAAARLLHLRGRLRHGEPADHDHRRARHARRAGGRGGRRRLDLAPGRADAGGGGRRAQSPPPGWCGSGRPSCRRATLRGGSSPAAASRSWRWGCSARRRGRTPPHGGWHTSRRRGSPRRVPRRSPMTAPWVQTAPWPPPALTAHDPNLSEAPGDSPP